MYGRTPRRRSASSGSTCPGSSRRISTPSYARRPSPPTGSPRSALRRARRALHRAPERLFRAPLVMPFWERLPGTGLLLIPPGQSRAAHVVQKVCYCDGRTLRATRAASSARSPASSGETRASTGSRCSSRPGTRARSGRCLVTSVSGALRARRRCGRSGSISGCDRGARRSRADARVDERVRDATSAAPAPPHVAGTSRRTGRAGRSLRRAVHLRVLDAAGLDFGSLWSS